MIALYAAFLSFRWLRNDEQATRKGLMLAQALMFLFSLAISVIDILESIFGDVQFVLWAITWSGLSIFLSLYYYTVASDYSKLHGDEHTVNSS